MPISTNPWLNHPLHRNPNPGTDASFVEYLRWMRVLRENTRDNSQIGLVNNGEVLELLDILQEKSNYNSRLRKLTERTRKLATVSFQASAPWRIRVGGVLGPASMLLPAFDTLGMPYIPSTTLKGVTREIAERDRNMTPDKIREIFGELEPTACMGKVIFLDAYPLPFPEIDEESEDELSGLVPDMANSIWTWDANHLKCKANPNIFLSLRKVTCVIGLRVHDNQNLELLNLVQAWLMKGLTQGIGSRVNSGYGVLEIKTQEGQEKPKKQKIILRVQFELRGQLSHGRQQFRGWNPSRKKPEDWQTPGNAIAEVRPPAFRSILRYWFRTLALGVLQASLVQDWELRIFGGIEPEAKMGMFQLEIPNGRVKHDNARNEEEDCGLAEGTLILRQSQVMTTMQLEQQTALTSLLQSLTWLAFHLGGVGQGARRPCYSRQDRSNPQPPFWRGSSIKLIRESEDKKYWDCPKELGNFQKQFRSRLNSFYTYLSTLIGLACDSTQPRTVQNHGNWAEAIDSNCRIICVQGNIMDDKPPALALLHQEARRGNSYDPELCGSISERSPIWIARVGSRFNETGFSDRGFDVVTIFGVNNPRRQRYFDKLKQTQSPVTDFREIWIPLENV